MDIHRFGAGLIGLASVALGAFGAHVLGAGFDARSADLWDTATLYGLVHAAAGLATRSRAAGLLFSIGALIFCGALYALALGAPSALGAIAPLGGLAFLAGWLLTAVAALRGDKSDCP